MKLFVVLVFVIGSSLGWTAQSSDEQEYEKWMKTAGATMGTLRINIQGKKADETVQDAAKLIDVFKNSEKFWASRKKDDAVEWSKKSLTIAQEVEAAAKAGDFEKAGASARGLGANCAACHNAYREKLPDGGYRFKQ